MKKFLKFTIKILFVLNLLFIFSCQTSEKTKEKTKLNKTTFKVGVIIPLTGGLAPYGTALKNGFELAIAEQSDKFKNIKFIYEDSKYEGKTALSAYNKLLTIDKPNLFYTWGVSPNEALIPVLAKNNTPTVVETTIKEATIDKPNIVRAARTGEGIAKAIVSNFLNKKDDKVIIVSAEIPFFRDINSFISLNDTNKAVKKIEYFSGEEQDFKSFILSIKKNKFTTVGIFLLPDQTCNFLKIAAELNYTPRFFGTELFDSKDLIANCPDNIEGIHFTSSNVSKNFRQKYFKTYKLDNYLSHAGQAYDAANIIAQAVYAMNSKEQKIDIIDEITAIKMHSGVVGEFKFSNTYGSKDFLMPITIKKIEGRKIVTIKKVS